MADEPYHSWALGQQVMLDHWVCKVCLAWGWEQERYLHDAKFEHELGELRAALFPELALASHGEDDGGEDFDFDSAEDGQSESDRVAAAAEKKSAEGARRQLEALVKGMDWNDPLLSDQVNEWYVSFGKWQTLVFKTKGDYSKWTKDEKDGLDEWVLQSCLPSSAVLSELNAADEAAQGNSAKAEAEKAASTAEPGSVNSGSAQAAATASEEAAAQALAKARFQLFPRLDPTGLSMAEADALADASMEAEAIEGQRKASADDVGKYDVVPELKDVRRIIAVKRQEAKQLLKVGDDAPPPAATAAKEGAGGGGGVAYTRFLGLEAIRMLESQGLQESEAKRAGNQDADGQAAPRPGLFSGLVDDSVGGNGLSQDGVAEGDDAEEDDDEEEDEFAGVFEYDPDDAEDLALTAEIRERWDAEAAVMATAKRDEWWKKREAAREELIFEAAALHDEDLRANALAFALPGIGEESGADSGEEDQAGKKKKTTGQKYTKSNKTPAFTK